jgi:hypothetical protein
MSNEKKVINDDIFFTKTVSICKNLTVCQNINGCSNLDIGNRAVIGGNTSIDPDEIITTTDVSICGYTPIGRAFSAGTDPNTTSKPVSTTEVPVIAITGISTYNHENILPTSFTIMDIANNNGYLYRFRLYLSPTGASSPLNGASIVNVDVNSVVSYSIYGLTIPAGSIIVDQGYFYGRGIVSFNSLSDVFTNIIQITSNIDNVCDVLLLTAEKTGTTGTGNVFASISWQEIY